MKQKADVHAFAIPDAKVGAVDTLTAAGIHWLTALNAVTLAACCGRAGKPQYLGRWEITCHVRQLSGGNAKVTYTVRRHTGPPPQTEGSTS